MNLHENVSMCSLDIATVFRGSGSLLDGITARETEQRYTENHRTALQDLHVDSSEESCATLTPQLRITYVLSPPRSPHGDFDLLEVGGLHTLVDHRTVENIVFVRPSPDVLVRNISDVCKRRCAGFFLPSWVVPRE